MIKQGQCLDCKNIGKVRISPIVSERCQYHYRIYRAKICAERKKLSKKVSDLVKPEDKDRINLVYWYSDRMKECNGRCAECGEKISLIDRHSSIAHILPKKPNHGFPSVATHPLNWKELGPRCGCHNKYDVSWLSASKMKIFPEAVEIATKLYPLLTHEEQGRFPEVFYSNLQI